MLKSGMSKDRRSGRGKACRMLAVSSLTVALLSACGNQTGSDPAAKSEPTSNAKHDPVELVFIQDSSGWTEAKFMEQYGNKIKEKFPWITPKFIPTGSDKGWYANAITSGQQIDIDFSSIGHTFSSVLAYNMQFDLSDLIKKYKMDLNRFEPGTIAIQRSLANGGIYGIPTSNGGAALYYNKDIFDKFAVPYPKNGMTWDDTYEMAKKLTRLDNGVQYRGLTLSFFLSNVNQLSLPFIDPKTNKALFDQNPKFVELINNFARFYFLPGAEVTDKEISSGKQNDFFSKDMTAAMNVRLTGVPNFPASLNWDVASLPTFKELPGVGTQSYPSYFYITNTSKHKDDAFQVVAYLASDEYQMWQSKRGVQTVLNNPAIEQAYGQDVPSFKGKHVVEAYFGDKFAAPAPLTADASDANHAIFDAFNEVILKQKDVNTALRDATEKLNKQIETSKSK